MRPFVPHVHGHITTSFASRRCMLPHRLQLVCCAVLMISARKQGHVMAQTSMPQVPPGLGYAASQFVQALQRSRPGTRGVVLDVGANAGQWVKLWGLGLKEFFDGQSKPLSLFLFEPQPIFTEALSKMAQSMGATFIDAAAWKRAGSMTLHTDKAGSTAASLKSHPTFAANGKKTNSVHTIDLAAYMNGMLPESNDNSTLSMMKMDVEGAEFELLPWLLARGALCRVTYLLIEWHLNALPPHERLSAFAFRLGFHAQLRAGCESPPVLIEHEEPATANLFITIPGLYTLAEMHTNSFSNPQSAPFHTRPFLKSDRAYQASKHQVPCDGLPGCKARGTENWFDREGGMCTYDRMSCGADDARVEMKISEESARVLKKYKQLNRTQTEGKD